MIHTISIISRISNTEKLGRGMVWCSASYCILAEYVKFSIVLLNIKTYIGTDLVPPFLSIYCCVCSYCSCRVALLLFLKPQCNPIYAKSWHTRIFGLSIIIIIVQNSPLHLVSQFWIRLRNSLQLVDI
jgi:hypothetical protein